MNRMTMTHGKVIAFGIAIAVALLALAPGTWAPALAQTAGTPTPEPTAAATETTVPAGEAATLEAGAGKTIDIPAGATTVEATVSFTPAVDVESDPTGQASQDAVTSALATLGVSVPDEVEAGDAVVASVFLLEAVDADGNPITFDEPVTMQFDLTPEILAAAGGDANNVELQFFDEAADAWVPVACTGSGNTLTCELPHFSVWALVVQTAASDGDAGDNQVVTPVPANTGSGVSEAGGSGTNLGLLMGVLALIAVAGGLGAHFVMGRARE